MASFSSYTFSFILIFFLSGMRVSAVLSHLFYSLSCPQASSIIQREVYKAIDNDPRMGASLLRLHFHDCFVNGCDASVLLDDIGDFIGEKTAGPNINSLRGFEVIDTIKSALEEECPGKVSCADILALAARDSVVKLEGTTWIVPLGRQDSKTANFTGANTDLPSTFSDLSTIISSFANKGFTTKEIVILSGAHTIGEARCISFRTRIYNETNIDPAYANSLKVNCSSVGGDDNLAPLDVTTKKVFDNAYFVNLKNYKGLLHSDQELYNGDPTKSTVEFYSLNLSSFLTDFGNAMVKMGNLSAPPGSEGEIRTNCRKWN